ncbi:MgtC/SapB family protein [Furfurilactobacillus curtus]|uniref:MgtC/SapB/SrpB/YhiD N-terminal domain-containing protein n=1 Tax=Furfurilactobacillus curtus TaxID=1746200 RepID=A0ABQ5JLH6_9LACO
MPLELDWCLRLLLAAACGGLIGYERSSRLKNAGIRTHIIVAVGAALIMIVSKYGFADVLTRSDVVLDPSRIAAQIVSGISFIGAGTILVKQDNVNGLTTAAGVWATAAVGMAAGAGLYFIALAAMLVVVAVQFLFRERRLLKYFLKRLHVHFKLTLNQTPDGLAQLKHQLQVAGLSQIQLDISAITQTTVTVEIDAVTQRPEQLNQLFEQLINEHGVQSVERS